MLQIMGGPLNHSLSALRVNDELPPVVRKYTPLPQVWIRLAAYRNPTRQFPVVEKWCLTNFNVNPKTIEMIPRISNNPLFSGSASYSLRGIHAYRGNFASKSTLSLTSLPHTRPLSNAVYVIGSWKGTRTRLKFDPSRLNPKSHTLTPPHSKPLKERQFTRKTHSACFNDTAIHVTKGLRHEDRPAIRIVEGQRRSALETCRPNRRYCHRRPLQPQALRSGFPHFKSDRFIAAIRGHETGMVGILAGTQSPGSRTLAASLGEA